MSRVHVLSGAAQFDERRNSSRVFLVPESAIVAARQSRERYQRERPEWYRWIEAGCPPLTQAEYDARPGWHAKGGQRRG